MIETIMSSFFAIAEIKSSPHEIKTGGILY